MMRIVFTFITLLSLTVFSSGCVRFDVDEARITSYSFDVIKNMETVPKTSLLDIVVIEPGKAAPAYEDSFFVYRTNEFQYETDYYNQFIAPPIRVISEAFRQWFTERQSVKGTMAPTYSYAPTLKIIPQLTELYGDYRDLDDPRARCSMQITVLDLEKKKAEVLFDKTYKASIQLKAISPQELFKSWNRGLQKILLELENDVITYRR